jgi:predicted NBD/HSP70 family sugar kinase
MLLIWKLWEFKSFQIVSKRGNSVHVVAGVDLGGTAINYTLLNGREQFLIESLFEHPARSKEGPDICLQQIEDGLKKAVE